MDGQKVGLLNGLVDSASSTFLPRPTLAKEREKLSAKREILAQDILDLKDLSIIHGLTAFQEGLNLKSLEV